MKKNKTKLIGILLATAMLLSACSGITGKSVEEEVAENLTENVEEESTSEAETEEEVQAEEEAADEDHTLEVVQTEVTPTDGHGNEESTHNIEDDDTELQVVFIGDSIFDAVRDETGIARIVGENLPADVYNIAVGGTSAGLRMDKSTDLSTWSEPTLMGIVYAMTGQVDRSILNNYRAGEVMAECDFTKTDYFIIEYGTNDFLHYIPLGAEDYKEQYYFYFRTTYDMAVRELKKYYPDAKIILCTPYYEEFWSADRTRYIGDCHTVNNGYGTLLNYISVIQDVGRDFNLPCLNMYNLLGVNIYNVNDTTTDGIHPAESTRSLYAQLLTQAINEIEETGTTTLDWQAQAGLLTGNTASETTDGSAAAASEGATE